MNIDYNLLVMLIMSAVLIGGVMWINQLRLYVRPEDLSKAKEDLRKELSDTANAIRKENIDHCQNCNKVKALENRNQDIDRKIDRLETKIDELPERLLNLINKMGGIDG